MTFPNGSFLPTRFLFLLAIYFLLAGSGTLPAQQDATTSGKQSPESRPAVLAPPPNFENVSYGPWDRNVLDLWTPDADAPTPLIIHIHGGGFVGGNKEQVRRTDQVRNALDRGIAFASIQYRFRYPDNGDTSDNQRTGIQNILRDSARAVQFLRHHAQRYNLDPTRVACYGGSAGAGTSIWLAFHDDLADPDAEDPVLRQSSRISAAGMLNGQYTYDLSQWDSAFADYGGNMARTHGTGGKLEFHKFFGVSENDYNDATGAALRADVDMKSLVSPDDPPIFILTTTPNRACVSRGIYNHHPHHARLIEQECRECGIEVVCLLPKLRPADAQALNQDPDLMFDFFAEHLVTKPLQNAAATNQAEAATSRTMDLEAATPLPTADPATVGIDPEKLSEVRTTIESFVDQDQIAGAVVAIARRGRLVAWHAFGMRDVDEATPMQTDSIFRIYSMTKPVASVAAMILVEQGKIKLDDPVARYIPEFAEARVYESKEGDEIATEPLQRAVTLRDLLRHTSGLTYGFLGNSPVDQMYREANVLSEENDIDQMSRNVAGIPLMCQPGSEFNYGVSVDVLGRVIEVASGQPLDLFMKEQIFDPLEMEDTGFFVPKDSHERFTSNYAPRPGGGLMRIDAPASSKFSEKPKLLSGGGGLVSTASDYMRFAQMILNGGELDGVRILKPETIKEMTKNQLPRSAFPVKVGGSTMEGVGFGLGFSVVVDPGRLNVAGEYGWDGMASTHYWASKEKDIAVVVLTQRTPYTGQVKDAIKPIIYGAITDGAAEKDQRPSLSR